MDSVVPINQGTPRLKEKSWRRKTLLGAAEVYFLEVGYEAFSMNRLAERAGVGKGTLCLYFTTREELLITLYVQSLIRWSCVFTNYLVQPMSSKGYARALYLTALADRAFLPLLNRLEHIIEHDVEIDRLTNSKTVSKYQIEKIAELTYTSLNINELKATEVVNTLGVLLIDATKSSQEGSLDGANLSQDFENLFINYSSEPLFVKNAVRIIEAVRKGAFEDLEKFVTHSSDCLLINEIG